MAAVPLPADTDVLLLKNRLYDEYRIEVPVYEWFPHPIFGERGKEMVGEKLIRISVQGYNTKRDIEKLCRSLFSLLKLE
jgi:selenocysteine lyase/cysteine desulfurase